MHKLTLHSILSSSVFTVTPDTPLPDVLSNMETLRISCVVAVDGAYHPVGIFTEQDAIRLMAQRKVVAQLRMSDVMSSPPLTARADMDFRDAYQLISNRGHRHLIIVAEDGKLIGIVSEADFIHHMGMEYLVELKTVSSAMSRDLVTLQEDATLANAVDLMAKHRISCVIITRDGAPVGILTERDTVTLARTINDPTRVDITRVMRSPVQTIDAQHPLQQAMALMESSSIRRLVVVENTLLKGIVTRHDIVKNMQGRYIEFLHETLERQRKDLHQAHQQIELTRQQLLYHNLMDQISDTILVSQEHTGIIVDCNDQACRSLGYTRDELLRMTIFDIATSISPGTSWAAEVAIFEQDGRRLVETQHRRRDGSMFPVEVNASLIQKDDERYIVAVARDLTERKQVEARLHLKNTALNSTANAVIITNRDGIIEWTNPAFTLMTGYALEDAIGKRPKELVKSGVQPREFYEVLWNTILSGKVWRGEVVNKHKNGTHYTEEMTITPVYTDAVITHFIAVKQDISARKAAELKLAQSDLTYRGIINSINEAVYIQGADGIFLDVNQGAETMTGYSRAEIVGQSPDFLSAPDKNDLKTTLDAVKKAFAGIPQQFEFWGRRKDGSIFPKSVSLVKGDYFGQAVVIAVARDISEQKTFEATLQANEKRYRSLVENVTFPVVIVDVENSSIAFANKPAQQLFEINLTNVAGITASHFYVDPAVRADIVARQAAGETIQGEEVEMRTATGKHIWVLMTSASGVFAGRPCHIATLTDVTHRKADEAQLREAAAVMQNTHEGVMITDASANLIAVNAAFTEMTGYSAEEALGKNPRLLSSGRQDKAFYEKLWENLLKHGFWQGELWNRRKNGEIYPQLLTISTIYDDNGRPDRYLGVFADITQLKENQAKLEFMAHHDPLTMLPNRALAESRLKQELEQAHRHSQQLSVLFIDLDRFKQVNDSFGHLVGDELLCAVAKRLNERLREGDTLGRLGGDEFILIASPMQEKQDAAIIARDFINALSEPFKLSNGVEVFIGGSIGISLFPDDGTNVADLTKNADAAMYLAKENGRNQFSFYTSELNADARNKLELENDLRRAVLHDELLIHFQPKVDLRTGRICGAEALARWQKADASWVAPSQFIPLAEKSGVILTIGNWVLEAVCAQIRAWKDAGLPEVCIAVNVSARQFRSGHLDKLVAAALDKFKIPPHSLELELTESMLMHEPDRAIAAMQKLKNVGVKLSLDDFGTGYSNFGYLRRFPIDSLKIDQSFVQGVTMRAEDAMIVDSIIGLAQRMKLRVISEGVETNEQLAYLSTRGCDEMQGYLFSKALPADDFAAMLKRGEGLPTR
ncbi:MAG: PAS domain S-box protein [Sideroxydans sp.]|jgi:diguanylate cyclase (GGDEF)-like protein/PAS domain S-box-containing protein